MIRSDFRKINPIAVGGLLALVYFAAFTGLDYLSDKHIDFARRVTTSLTLGIVYFIFQVFVNRKIDSLHNKVGSKKHENRSADSEEKVQ